MTRRPRRKPNNQPTPNSASFTTHYLDDASAHLWDAFSYIDLAISSLNLAVQSAGSANAYVSDDDSEALKRRLIDIARSAPNEIRGLRSALYDAHYAAKSSADGFRDEANTELVRVGREFRVSHRRG